ncbi:hypothetical protein KKC94_03435 [Patescibacteria group bacterium]|nr:hypothetical protein [Patescibacteria group bacterium]
MEKVDYSVVSEHAERVVDSPEFDAFVKKWVDFQCGKEREPSFRDWWPISSVSSKVHAGLSKVILSWRESRRREKDHGQWLRNFFSEKVAAAAEEGNAVFAMKDNKIIGVLILSRLEKVAENEYVSGEDFEREKEFAEKVHATAFVYQGVV